MPLQAYDGQRGRGKLVEFTSQILKIVGQKLHPMNYPYNVNDLVYELGDESFDISVTRSV